MIRKLIEALKPRKINRRWRSAVTGKFVTEEFALLHPRECVAERT